MLNELSRSIRFDNASKGFDPTEGGVSRYILLAISEICEAQEELRDGRGTNEVYYQTLNTGTGSTNKPEGFPVEIADAIIRLLDIGAKFEFDFEDLSDVESADYSDSKYTIDDWLVGAINTISMMSLYEPIKETDFEEYLKMGIGTLFLLCEKLDIKIMDVINEKLEYNRSRPPKHGRKF